MEQIRVTFPIIIPPLQLKYLMEVGLKSYSAYECQVEYDCQEEGENVFIIRADKPEAFYFIGMQASMIIDKFNNISK